MFNKIFLLLFVANIINETQAASLNVGQTCTPPWSISGPSGSCGCVDDKVECKGLSQIRPFAPNTKYKSLGITLSNITLTDNTFHNLNITELIIPNNRLTINVKNPTIFLTDALKKNVKVLNLANNGLTFIPADVISNLEVLQSLDISGNPIPESQFAEDVFRSVGDTLEVLTIGHPTLSTWPEHLKHLQMLKKLNVSEGSFYILPERAFYGFEGSLRQLVIQKTNLISIPFAIGRLTFLDTLHFDHNKKVGDIGLRVPAISGLLPYLSNVSLQDDNAHTLPESLVYFEKLKNLDVSGNDLEFVSDQSAKNIKSVTSLSMRNSNISRIPGSLHTMSSLQFLDLSGNSIHSLERDDLSGLQDLEVLFLNDNPILYLNKEVFAYLFNLRAIYLGNTNLTTIPCAIGGIKQDRALIDFTGNKIECNCDIKWIDHWIHDDDMDLTFRGECSTIETSIQDYITNYLPLCPAYHKDCYSRKTQNK